MNTGTNPSTNPNSNPNPNLNTNPSTNPNTNPNAINTGTHASGGRISSFKTAVRGVHGASEVLRGSLNQAVDSAFGNHEAAAHHRAVTEKGLSRMGYSGVSSGPTPVGSATVQQQPHGRPAGHATGVEPVTATENNAATNNGPHVATTSNRLDPRVGDGEPAIAGDATMPATVDPQVRRPDNATIEQGATTETGHHKHVLNPSAINFKFWKKGEGDTGKVDNTLAGVDGNTNHQDNLASTNYDGRITAPGVAGGNTVNQHPIPPNYDAHGTNPNNEPDHSNATAATPHTEHTQTQHQYQQPALPPHTTENGTAKYPSGSTTTTKPGTSKFAQKLGAGTSTGTRMEGPPVANMD